ncbi:MAG: hypothetical protein ACLS9K_00445 [Lachnospira eligens]
MIVGTHPLKKDTNGNGINDYDDDVDKDKVNGYEVPLELILHIKIRI